MSKKATWGGLFGPYTQVKCLFKALIFLTCKKNIGGGDNKIKATEFKFFTDNDYIQKLYLLQFETCQTYYFYVTGQNIWKKSLSRVFMGTSNTILTLI